MEVETDPNLLVVNLEHCVSTETRHFGKSIYTTNMTANTCGHDVLQLATPVQCIGDINQPLSRIQHQHLTQLQPIQYPQVQVAYDNGSLQPPNGNLLAGGTSLYQAPPPPPATLHHYHPSPAPAPPQTYGSYITPLSVTTTPHSLQDFSSLISTAAQQNLQEVVPSQLTPEILSTEISNDTATSLEEQKKKEDIPEPEPPPADEYEYFKEIERFLEAEEFPPNTSVFYNKMLKKRAQNYIILDGVLHHNPKEPRRVVMTKDQQTTLLESHHVRSPTGVHIGMKKMFTKLRSEYFWRGMYVSIANYVKRCTGCRDIATTSMPPLIPLSNIGKHTESASCEGTSIGVQTVSKIWTEVEIQLCGPYNSTRNRNSYIATIVDPNSKFILATALPFYGLATRLTHFILTSLFTFGFTCAYLVATPKLYSTVEAEITRRTRDLHKCNGLLHRREKTNCEWIVTLFAHLVNKKPNRWDKELDKFLYQFRTGEVKQFANIGPKSQDCIGNVTPFYSMFQRTFCSLTISTSIEDKENNFHIVTGKGNKTKIQNKIEHKTSQGQKNEIDVVHKNTDSLLPKDCEASLEEDEDTFDDEITSIKNKETSTNADDNEITMETTLEEDSIGPVQMTVTTIKAFLNQTRLVRQRRGNYNKYPDELRERMASYALKHGSQEAAKHFSEILGTQVHESTIRNLIKSRVKFGLSLRQEIAKYATENGISEASEHYSSKLNTTISNYLIKRFIALYGPNRLHSKKGRNRMRKDMVCFTAKVKNDIGSYAAEHSVEETINYFRDLLGITIKESAVKKLNRDYLLKHQHTVHQDRNIEKQEVLTKYNGQSNNLSYSDTGLGLVSQNGYYSNVQLYQQQQDYQPVQNIEAEPGNSSVLTHHFLLVPQEPQTAYDLTVQQEKVNETNASNNVSDYQQYSQLDSSAFVDVSEDNNQLIEQPITQSVKDHKNGSKTKTKKRGKYSTFSPELRAEIGKYAVENGCLKASHHFSSILGHDLPESTARGIRAKYLRKLLKNSEVTSLGYLPRGRAPLLGKYDKIVQDCLKELIIKRGEKSTTFLAMVTARKLLNKYEPSLLKENGGNIDLNISWAKSFLKRLGIRNNS